MNTKFASYLIAFLALVALYLTFKLFKRNRMTIRIFLVWVVLWFSMGIFALFPNWLDYIRKTVEMHDRLAFLFVSSIVLLFVLTFYFSSKLAASEKKIASLAQKIAFLEHEIEHNINPEKLNTENYSDKN